MTIQTGYTYELSPEQRDANRKIATEAIQHDLQAKTMRLSEPLCSCAEIMGDDPNCPLHGKMFHSGITASKEAEWLKHTQAVLEEVEAQRDARDLGTYARGG